MNLKIKMQNNSEYTSFITTDEAKEIRKELSRSTTGFLTLNSAHDETIINKERIIFIKID